MHQRLRLGVLSTFSFLLLATSLTACTGERDPDSADRASGAVIAPGLTGEILDLANVKFRGFVESVDRVVGHRGAKFERTREGPFWKIGKVCKLENGCDWREYEVETEAPPKPDGKARYDGEIRFADGVRTRFQSTSFVEWDNVSIKKGESLDYRWAYLRYSGEDGTSALAWFIDDTGKLVDIVVLSSTRMLVYGESLNQTSWMDGVWTAKEDFHGSVRFSLSAGLLYQEPESIHPAVSWPGGVLLLDKTVHVRPKGTSTVQQQGGAQWPDDPKYACTVMIESNKESLISPNPKRQEVATMCPWYYRSSMSDLGPDF